MASSLSRTEKGVVFCATVALGAWEPRSEPPKGVPVRLSGLGVGLGVLTRLSLRCDGLRPVRAGLWLSEELERARFRRY